MRWSRCFPRSLFGRNVLLLVALLIASQIAWLTLFRVMVQVPRLERLASYVLEYDALLQLALKRVCAGLARQWRFGEQGDQWVGQQFFGRHGFG